MSATEPTPDPWSEQEGERWRRTLHIGELLDGLPDDLVEGNRALLTAALRLVWDSIPPHLRDMRPAPAYYWPPATGDPQYEQRRRLAAEAQHLLGMVNRRATMDEMHRVAGRCVAICEGEDVGVLAEGGAVSAAPTTGGEAVVSATCTYHVGDALSVLRTLPDASADLVLSSPPFMALRSYLPPDHPDKAKEMGSEATPGEFIDALLDVVEELARVLAPHGTLAFELGDTYAGSGGAGGDYLDNGLREGQPIWISPTRRSATTAATSTQRDSTAAKTAPTGSPERLRTSGKPRSAAESRQGIDAKNRGNTSRGTAGRLRAQPEAWPLDKSLCLIPELFRFALAYGLNPLTGRQTPRWRVRNVVRWCRPNPPVGALGDKFRPGTSDLVVACKSRSRYFDLDAVRTEPVHGLDWAPGSTKGKAQFPGGGGDASRDAHRFSSNPAGAPPLDWWAIPTKGYTGAHYATFPPALLTRPILAMCPERVCTVCGEPSRRIVGEAEYHQSPNAHGSGRAADDVAARKWASGIANGKNQSADLRDGGVVRTAPTLGWTSCGHDSWRAGLVLDPFAGTGTTGLVATGHGRSAVLIDLDERNLHLARERIGMFLTEAPS